MISRLLCGCMAALVIGWSINSSPWLMAQITLDQPPISYYNTEPNDPISNLQKRLDAGDIELEYESNRGYLESVLKHLAVPPSSQVLVFSKTSFQLKRIGPLTPRALYFSDDVYMGWVRGGDVMEFSAVDPKLGTNFYTLSQHEEERPKFVRHTHECLQCHGSTMTRGVPGHVVRSVYPGPDGQPLLQHGSFLTDHKSPFQERWGGWYVTGSHGKQRHLGNLLVRFSERRDELNLDRGANVEDLSAYFSVKPYLTPHSDIVALMVLEHQSAMHNVLTSANFLTRLAMRDQKTLNEMLGRSDDYRSDTTLLRLRSAAEPVVKGLLFVDETPLTDSIRGSSSFVEDFAKKGPRDTQGRSLRDFDLQKRMFKFGCSYMIYSQAFADLPAECKDLVYQLLDEVLQGNDPKGDYTHLTQEDRIAIREILLQTKTDLPETWNKKGT